ncbi:metalloregulator ArsR/SmtB family transcription factor [Bacillus sp. ISL-46]|uniref:ArsR/SmtB family transcription factor n=1 Tax=Bacillus sp. ISL-46 TaxID=2819129 RepID=UPI001BE71B78|nr:metalloregulator ArsR/SmtB family transcription factor [Bacillus sp. ISL-46]MBT2724739.1 winged helix-turn-helix transcriptional regulator [Bacillus sp. ISL-46]
MALDAMDIKVKLIKGFADKTRLQILESIKDKEKTVSQIVEEIKGNQSNISQHLACLKGCGIIVGRQEGKYMYYGIRDEQIKSVLTMFDLILGDVEKQVADCDKNDQCLSIEGMNCNG